MGASKSYKNAVRWGGKTSSRGKESAYTKGPAARMEGTHMSGGSDALRKGSKSGGSKSKTISGPSKRGPSASY